MKLPIYATSPDFDREKFVDMYELNFNELCKKLLFEKSELEQRFIMAQAELTFKDRKDLLDAFNQFADVIYRQLK